MTPRTLLSVTIVCLGLVGCGPIGPLPGGALRGPVAAAPTDWTSFADVEQIQLESRPGDPHSVNTWCGVVDRALYVPTSLILGPDDPTERGWVRNVVDDARVRLRIEGQVYELRAVRVEEAEERERVRAALLEKYEVEPDAHAGAAWIFRMEPR